MKNRQGATWSLEAQPWAPGKAFAEVAGKFGKWGLKAPDALEALVRHLVATVVADGGRHVSLHLAEQNNQALVLAFSHQPHPSQPWDDDVLTRLRELGAASCGTEMTGEGRQVWAVLDLASCPRLHPLAVVPERRRDDEWEPKVGIPAQRAKPRAGDL
ncbi:hypothetical protein ACFTY8_43765 [Streptomyces mirabilis]|uniref:hypothetical protein n=1 Tax=Streptomyces mirabilis TaxID=68239 RepID=UPI0036306BCB